MAKARVLLLMAAVAALGSLALAAGDILRRFGTDGRFGDGQRYYCATTPRVWTPSPCGCPAQPLNDFCSLTLPPTEGGTSFTWGYACWYDGDANHNCYFDYFACGAIYVCAPVNGTYPKCNGGYPIVGAYCTPTQKEPYYCTSTFYECNWML